MIISGSRLLKKCVIEAFQPLVELAIKNSGATAEKLLCMVKSYEYWYHAQDIGYNKRSHMQRRNQSTKAHIWMLLHGSNNVFRYFSFSLF
jgi:hypothetical protein